MPITLDDSVSLTDFADIVRNHRKVELDSEARAEMQKSRQVIEEIIETNDKRLYGVNTGFGDLYDMDIDSADQQSLQENLLMEYVTVGESLSDEEIRALMLARATVLASGRSGVRPVIVDRILECLNNGVHPVLGNEGNANVGISAGIGPLLIGEGKARYEGAELSASEALQKAEIAPVSLEPGDGLPLMDGPSLLTGRLALAVLDTKELLDTADIVGSLTFALMGQQPSAFASRVVEARPHEGDGTSARIIRETLDLDTDTTSTVVQDPLSIRTIPQVHGAAREGLKYALSVVRTELGSPGDNPLIFPDGTVASCGGFNGQHASNASDTLRRSLVKVGRASERRMNLYIEGRGASPKFVAGNPGVETGLERAHFSAASLVEEAASLGSVSDGNMIVSAGQEDIHSLGTLATAYLSTSIRKIRSVLAIELLAAIRAYELTGPEVPARADEILDGLSKSISSEGISAQVAEVSTLIEEGFVTDLATSVKIHLPDLDESSRH